MELYRTMDNKYIIYNTKFNLNIIFVVFGDQSWYIFLQQSEQISSLGPETGSLATCDFAQTTELQRTTTSRIQFTHMLVSWDVQNCKELTKLRDRKQIFLSNRLKSMYFLSFIYNRLKLIANTNNYSYSNCLSQSLLFLFYIL